MVKISQELFAEGLSKNNKDTVDVYTEIFHKLVNPTSWFQDPLELYTNYYKLAFEPRKPLDWATENDLIFQHQTMVLRHFPNPDKITAKYPVVVLPPQAGHDSKLADYSAEQSLVRTLQRQGLDVYVIEWLSATKDDADLGINDYIRFTDLAVDKIRTLNAVPKVHMIGQCQGGWQVAMYASLQQEKISSLVVAASPIDFQAGYGVLNEIMDTIPLEFYEQLTCKGFMDGQDLLKGFRLLQSNEHYHLKYMREFSMALSHDEKAIDRHVHFERWYNNTQNLPKRFYLEVVKEVFKNNCLANPGSFQIDTKPIDLRNIVCLLLMMGGTKDHITPHKQVFEMRNLVGISQENIEEILVEAGHIGVLMGSKVLKNSYPDICSFMKRSEELGEKLPN